MDSPYAFLAHDVERFISGLFHSYFKDFGGPFTLFLCYLTNVLQMTSKIRIQRTPSQHVSKCSEQGPVVLEW